MPRSVTETSERLPHSQTLDRGVRVLEALADGAGPLSIDALAERLGVHRSIVYRMVRTLEDHRLVARRPDGLWTLGSGLAVLARDVAPDLTAAALPELAAVANEVAMTCFLVVTDGRECVTLVSVEPRHGRAVVAQRPGTRHPINRGAPGLALLSTMPPKRGERAEVSAARRNGYAKSHDEVVAGLTSLAVPVVTSRATAGAIAVVYVTTDVPQQVVASRLRQAALSIAAEIA